MGDVPMIDDFDMMVVEAFLFATIVVVGGMGLMFR